MNKVARIFLMLLLISTKNMFAIDPIDVTDMIFNIGSSSEKSIEYRFAAGDTIIINAGVVKGNDISEIAVVEWPYSTKFQAVGVENVVDKKIYVPKTNIYTFNLKNTAALKSKTYQLNIKRIPSNSDMIMFNTSAEWDTIYDTTYVAAVETVVVKMDMVPKEIVNTQVKIGSQLSGDYQSYLQVDIPEGTNYLAYWIGVGQEANEGLQSMTEALPEAAALMGIVNPVAAFALNLVPKLFTLSKGQQVDYYFIADYQNLTNFLAGQTFYMIKKGEEVITDYAKLDTPLQRTIYLGLYNSHGRLSDRLVTVNIVAVKITPKYKYINIKKPVVNQKVMPRL